MMRAYIHPSSQINLEFLDSVLVFIRTVLEVLETIEKKRRMDVNKNFIGQQRFCRRDVVG